MADMVQARAPFYAVLRGVPFQVNKGDVFGADDEVVTGNPQYFVPVNVRSSAGHVPDRANPRAARRSRVETATAAPGEVRSPAPNLAPSTPASPKGKRRESPPPSEV